MVLGVAQDAGVPHPGCDCARCTAAHEGRRPRERVACLGLVIGEDAWLFDATPDITSQLWSLRPARLRGVFLTHAHMGHVAGLLWLGREALAPAGIALHATAAMHGHLRGNAPWSDLYGQGRVRAAPCDRVVLGPAGEVVVTALPVPHRAEHGDAVGFRIEGPRRSVLFVPDIDRWEDWDRGVRAEVERTDRAYLDGTFASADELRGRARAEVPHPPIAHSVELLAGLGERVRFIHLNHTNPLLGDDAPLRAGGFARAHDGEVFAL